MGPGHGNGPDEFRARRERDVSALLSQISYLEEEIGLLRRKVSESPRQVRALEERIAEAEGRAAFLSERNDKLAGTLRDAREPRARCRSACIDLPPGSPRCAEVRDGPRPW